jgi:glutamyl-tRNA synthetase
VALARDVLAAAPSTKTGGALAERFAAIGWERFAAAIPSLKERARTLAELVAGALYIVIERPVSLDEKAAKIIDGDAKAMLQALLPRLETATSWTADELEAAVRAHVEETGAMLGKVAQPLRAALTGRTVSPPVFDVMAVLGREESLARLRDQAV